MTQLIDAENALRPMTAEEQRAAQEAMERVALHREEWLEARGGRLFPSSSDLIRRLHKERERELP